MKDIYYSTEVRRLLAILNLITFALLLFDLGFDLPYPFEIISFSCYTVVLLIGLLYTFIEYFYRQTNVFKVIFTIDVLSAFFVLFCFYQQFVQGSIDPVSPWLKVAVLLRLTREFIKPRIKYNRSFLNPAQLFLISFFSLIFIGSFLLMLPKATYNGISFIDALFTSTSAVCVTGLIVVDTSTFFTPFGQTLIMLLIQAGGLGILTFASYFSYFFKGGSTYENQIALSDMTNTEKIGEVFTTVKRILLVTFWVELIGAFLIYINLDSELIPSFSDRVYFSIFHTISAFCNAGFSTLPNGMMEAGFVSNYSLQLMVILIFVFGGLGFPIVINSIRYIKHVIGRYVLRILDRESDYRHWILTLSNKINLVTTGVLIFLGTILIFIMEFDNVLGGHTGVGKIITALFTATTPRTAGFNSIDFSQLHFSSVILIIFLMWIGASPASTGGGIKTSTFAIATLNYFSIARGKLKIEVFRREVADISVRRAFAVMSLSLVVIGTAIFTIAHFDKHLSLLDIAFECFSAYSTVGLSLGITAELSAASKMVVISTMFIGRVTMLTILIAFFKKVRPGNYSYPTDEILIN